MNRIRFCTSTCKHPYHACDSTRRADLPPPPPSRRPPASTAFFNPTSLPQSRSIPNVPSINMLFRGDMRRALFNTVSAAAAPSATFLGIRLTRPHLLRISALLALRSLVSSLPIPLHSSVLTYLFSFVFASLQTTLALAAASTLLHLDSLLPRLISRFMPPPADTPFLNLYASFVILLGPLCALLEAPVLTYEFMRISRFATDTMFRSESQGHPPHYRNLLLLTSTILTTGTLSLVYVIHQTHPPTIPFISALLLILYSMLPLVPASNILEVSLISLYLTLTFFVGLLEELYAPTPFLHRLLYRNPPYPTTHVTLFATTYNLQSDNLRAVLLLYTLTTLLVTMSRFPRFLRLIQLGHDALEQEESNTLQQHSPTQGTHSENPQPQQTFSSTTSFSPTPFGGPVNQLYSTAVLMAITFRVLIWTSEIENSEYMPLLVRAVQVIAVLVCYRGFLGSSEERDSVPTPEPDRDIAGNIIKQTTH